MLQCPSALWRAAADPLPDLTQQQRTDHAIAFCETIKEGGYTPMLYCNIRWFIEKLDIARIADYEKWFAQYFRKPFFPYTFRVWQYSSSGAIDGIKGNVDYNISFYDYGNPPAAFMYRSVKDLKESLKSVIQEVFLE